MSSYNNGKQSFDNNEIEFNVIRRLGVIAKYNTGWSKEVNIISWNKGANKLDIRDWDPEHLHMSKGVTLYEEEAERLLKVLKTQFEEARDSTAVIGKGWDTAKKSKDFNELDRITEEEKNERMKQEKEAEAERMAQEEAEFEQMAQQSQAGEVIDEAEPGEADEDLADAV